MKKNLLERSFYNRQTLTVAKDLLGKVLVKGNQKGIIVETEAYIGTEDKACHAAHRKREVCFPLWGPAGFSYVYLTYGMYYMLNISTEKKDFPAAVLIRALEPLENIEENTNGPGKLSRAIGITKEYNNIDMTRSPELYVMDSGITPQEVIETTRIGIEYAEEYKDKPWRFYIKDNPYVSKK